MRRGLLVLAVALATLAPLNAWAQSRRGGYGHIGHGPVARVYVAPYWGMWDPFWGPWGPYWGWGAYWGPTYGGHPNTGEVKLDTKVKDAQVFINGAYAGTSHEEKTMWLHPGKYTIEVRDAGHAPYNQTIYVTVGKTVHLHPDF